MHSYHDCHPDKKKRAEQLCADVQLYNGPLAVVARGSVGRMAEKQLVQQVLSRTAENKNPVACLKGG